MDENNKINENGGGELHGFDEVAPKTENENIDANSAMDILEKNFEDSDESQTVIPEQKDVFTQYSKPQPAYYSTPIVRDNKPKKRYSAVTLVICMILAAVIGASSGIGAMVVMNYLRPNDEDGSGIVFGSGEENNVNINVKDIDATAVEAVAEKVTPSVVGIRTTVAVNNFFGGTSEASGEGSGVIYSSDGYIITNYHVISDAIEYSSSGSAIQVFLNGDTENGYDATVVGYNISCDLAVIKISAANLTPISLADSSSLKVGQFVVAIGNPGGLEFMGSVTYGVISGLNRIVSDTTGGTSVELIQTDAAINPGNSGGALVNIEGKLIGINSSKIVAESYEGMGFAIPTDTVKDMCDKIIAREYDPDPYIGVTISERYDPDTLKKYGYPVGAVIYSVATGSPAAEAGLRQGDIITEFNDVEITHYTVLGDTLADCTPGDTVTVKIYRSGREYSGSIKVGSNNAY